MARDRVLLPYALTMHRSEFCACTSLRHADGNTASDEQLLTNLLILVHTDAAVTSGAAAVA